MSDVGRNVLFTPDGQHDLFSVAKPAEFWAKVQRKVLENWESEEIHEVMDGIIAAKLTKRWKAERILDFGEMKGDIRCFDRDGTVLAQGDLVELNRLCEGHRTLECIHNAEAGGWLCGLNNENGRVIVDRIRVSSTGESRRAPKLWSEYDDIQMVKHLASEWKCDRVFIVDSAVDVRAFDCCGVLVQEGRHNIMDSTGLRHLVCTDTGELFLCKLYDEKDKLVKDDIRNPWILKFSFSLVLHRNTQSLPRKRFQLFFVQRNPISFEYER